MSRIRHFSRRHSGIVAQQRAAGLIKEVFRKCIHLCSALVPLFLHHFRLQTLVLLALALILYTVAELLRQRGHEVPLISAVTAAAARKRDENRFVLGPVTLVVGILATALLFDELAATIGIFALAFGDGLASLAGKLFGRVVLPFSQGKTAEGSLACFAAVFISCYLACATACPAPTNVARVSLAAACVGMLIEAMPLKDLDNVAIPIAAALAATLFI